MLSSTGYVFWAFFVLNRVKVSNPHNLVPRALFPGSGGGAGKGPGIRWSHDHQKALWRKLEPLFNRNKKLYTSKEVRENALASEDKSCWPEHSKSICVPWPLWPKKGLCIKVRWGQGDKDIGMRVWGPGTWGRQMRDLRTKVWDTGMCGTSKTGT